MKYKLFFQSVIIEAPSMQDANEMTENGEYPQPYVETIEELPQ